MDIAQELLKQITLPTSSSPLVVIDKRELNGYYLALNVPSTMPPMPLTVKEFLPDQKLLTDDSSPFRRSRMWRLRAVNRTSGQLQVAYRSENSAKDVLEGRATSVRQRLLEKVVQQRFIKSLQRQISSVRDVVIRRRIDALLIFLCATVSGMREELLRCGWDTPSRLRSLASQAPKTATPPLSAQIVKSSYFYMFGSFNVHAVFHDGVVPEISSKNAHEDNFYNTSSRFTYDILSST
ncbi:hypothetical protein ANCCAN_25142 [Ancylostoma caninum]|uniref:Uncharacterized protein n=1 Tax=Ancylostoma caninum TaxID=29170 RepID=A0A368FAM0_ANCCA|nr:hypothetical protein ANCCAN_25142 [Ancylostoma caninum]